MANPPLVVSRRIHAERLVLLGWSRAILLQLAHPLMAAAVATHSSFRDGPLAAAKRLHQTVRAMRDLTFGDDARRARALAAIRAIHDRVHGVLPVAVGPFPQGAAYSANDPVLLLWVHATLIESVVLAYSTFVKPLAPADRDAYCEESAPVAIALGVCAADAPRTWDALANYLASVGRSGVLVVSADARSLAGAVLSPPMGAVVWPAAWLNRQFTIGTLPPDIRRQYGFEWTEPQAARLPRATGLVRVVRRLLPRPVALWRETHARASPERRPDFSA